MVDEFQINAGNFLRGKENIFLAIFLGLMGFFLSYIFSPFYTGGDQEFYRALYSEVPSVDGVDSLFEFYRNTVGASEPAYLLLTVIISTIFEKDFIYSVINGLFMGVSAFLVLRRGCNFFILLLLIVNFYFMTLFFSAERLKVAFLIFGLAFLFKGNWRWVLLVGSCLFHYQMVVPLTAYVIWYFLDFKKIDLRRLIIFTIGFLLIVVGIIYFSDNFLPYIEYKMMAYSEAGWGGLSALIKPLIFLSVALFYSKERARFFFAILPIAVAAYFLGSERITLIAFALMIFVASGINRGINVPVILSCLYFAFGGVLFILEFLEYGAVGV